MLLVRKTYPINHFSLISFYLGKARPIFSSFTAYERKMCLQSMCDAFKARNNSQYVKTIFIDKDLQEVEVWQLAFPHENILLCHNHCKNAFHSKFRNADIKGLFENLMNADCEEKEKDYEGL